MSRMVGAMLGVLMLLAGTALAGQQAGTFTLSPMIGGVAFEGDQNLDDEVLATLALGYNFTKNLAVEAALSGVDTETEKTGRSLNIYTARLDALYHFLADGPLVPYVAAGVGSYTSDPSQGDTETDLLLNYGAGLKYFLSNTLALRGDVRHVIETDDPEHNLFYSVGLLVQFAKAEPPPAPAPASAPVAVPAPPPPRDSDGDGVIDDLDKCPGTPKGVKVDKDGCPLDSDGDGVPDYLDKCPDTRKGEFVDKDGCTLKLTLHINFDFDKADIKPEFHEDLDKAGKFILSHPEVPYILIEGHTDWTGEEDYNQKLSERRAAAVVKYLVETYGLTHDRLVARGYGESRPVADNATAEGRYQNRRVEIICCVIIPR